MLDLLSSLYQVTDLQVTAPRSAHDGNVGIEANIHKKGADPKEIAKEIEKLDHVVFALESI
jgi:predicted fused transcriptional regulator/phosphomethylpyrimidine kinase